MCGIAGYFNANVDADTTASLLGSLNHRGPDANGTFFRENVGLIHTRLTILELSSLGAQPYRFEQLVLVFNGEIYNYKDVQVELIQRGYTFVSNSDTEVVIKAFHCWREQAANKFIGMFAFAVYNEATEELFAFRDRVGAKPFYYAAIGERFYFGSELKALKVFGACDVLDLESVALYFRFGYVPSGRSVFEKVSKLEPGHYLYVTKRGMVKQCYWTWPRSLVTGWHEDEAVERLEELLISSFRFRMVSDVPVGLFLSGGVDSSLLASVLRKNMGPVRSFTIGFEEQRFDESASARRIASELGIEHTEKILRLQEARGLFREFYEIYDEPFADTSGIPIACVSKLARDTGIKVVLSADGGDELFAGYNHYEKAYALYRNLSRIPSFARKALVSATRALVGKQLRESIVTFNFEHRIFALEELLLAGSFQDFFEAFIANQSQCEIGHLMSIPHFPKLNTLELRNDMYAAMMDWDLTYYLPDDLLVKIDRATMFYGVEAREPFIDHRLVEFATQLPTDLKIRNGKSKYLLKKLLERYLPPSLVQKEKRGFGIPIFAWFSQDLDEMFEHHLTADGLRNLPFLNRAEVLSELRKYRYYKAKRQEYNIEKLWRILSFVMWHKRWA